MAYVPIKDRGGFSNFGGNSCMIHEVNEDLSELTATSGYYDVGYFTDSEMKDDTPSAPIHDESGVQFNAIEGNRDVSLVVTAAQRNAANLNLAQLARNKYYILKKDEGIVNNSYVETYIFGKFDPSTVLTLPGGTWKATFRGIRNETAYTLSTAVLAGTGTAGFAAHATVTVTIPAYASDGSSGMYIRVETAKT